MMAATAGVLLTAYSAWDSYQRSEDEEDRLADELAKQEQEAEEAKQAAMDADEQAQRDAENERKKRLKDLQNQGRLSTFNVAPFASVDDETFGSKTLLG